jgi:hypothetical protein
MSAYSWKKMALAGMFGVGVIVASASSASAHRVFTRCDDDGDRCWRVLCDDDGDDCRQLPQDWSAYDRNYYYGNRYGYDRHYNDRYNDSSQYGRWSCDRDGDRCHWSSQQRSWWDW